MKICPICGARCFEDMETCYGCLHRFDEEGPFPLELSLPEEISLQDMSAEPLDIAVEPLRPKPRHAVPDGAEKAPDAAAAPARRRRGAHEGFRAEYKLVISLKPRLRDGVLEADGFQVEQAE